MKKQKLDSYWRIYRKQSGLTQKEISNLISKKSVAGISKIENGHTVPSLETAINLSILYRQPIAKLIPALLEQGQFQLLKRIDCLQEELDENKSIKNHAKHQYLTTIINDIAQAISKD